MAASTLLLRFHLDGIRDTGNIIGRGSYAVVRELDFRGLKCVGKELHDGLYGPAAPRERARMLQTFEEECELLGSLHHPNIVQFLGVHVGASSGLPVLVMEYLPTTLSGCLDRHGVFPVGNSYGILHDVALGLRYLHEHSPPIIHRDLSANNVLLTTNMSAKISDLGVAKILDMSPGRAAQMTQTQAPGTPAYMPPEAMVAHPKYDAKVDIFSFGVLTVHVLSGEWPIPSEGYAKNTQDPNVILLVFEYDRRRSTIQKIKNGHLLLGLIQQCLDNFSSHRPDAVEVVHQLREACSQVPPSLENRLELLQQVQSLRAELQQSSRKEIEALRRASETDRRQAMSTIESLKAELSSKILENNALRRQIQRSPVLMVSPVPEVVGTNERDVIHSNGTNYLKAAPTQINSRSKGVLSPGPREEDPTPSSLCASPRLVRPLHWSRKHDAPQELHRAQAVVMGEKVYVGGGRSKQSDAEYKLYRYNCRKDSWSTLSDCPTKYFGMAVFQGNLIAVGGVLRSGYLTGKVHRYKEKHFAQDWKESLLPMPTARYEPTVVTSSTLTPAIVVCGGAFTRDGAICNTVEVYSLSGSCWHTTAPLPIPCYQMSAVTIDNTCYLLGGLTEDSGAMKVCFSASIDSLIYEGTSISKAKTGSKVWKTLSDPPLTHSTIAVFEGNLLAIGGKDGESDSRDICIYRANGQWEVTEETLPDRACSGITAVNLSSGRLLIAGGSYSSKVYIATSQ